MKNLFKLFGMSQDSSLALINIMKEYKAPLALSSLLSFIIPFFEIVFIALLYFIINDPELLGLNSIFNELGLTIDLTINGKFILILIVAISILGMNALAKLYLAKIIGRINYETYIIYANKLLNSYLRAKPKYSLQYPQERIMNGITVEAPSVGTMASEMVNMLVQVIGSFILLLAAVSVSPLLILLVMLVGISLFLINGYFFKRESAITKTKIKATNNVIESISEVLNGLKSIVTYAAETRVSKSFDNEIKVSQVWRKNRIKNRAIVQAIFDTGLLAVLFMVIVLGIYLINMDISMLLAFMILMARFQSFISRAQQAWLKIKGRMPSVEFIISMISKFKSQSTEAIDINNYFDLDKDINISFRDAVFTYDGEEEPTLESLNCDFNSGDRVLIQGESGQGKSTFLMLLIGLLNPQKGSIQVNHRDLNEESFYEFRKNISYAAVDSYLFKNSLRENLNLTTKHSDKELDNVIGLSNLSEKVGSMESGLDSFIGVNGSMLSAGQRQRLIFARAMIKKGMLVVLDEATSNLDAGIEHSLIDNMSDSFNKESIIVLVAHKEPKNFKYNKKFLVEEKTLTQIS